MRTEERPQLNTDFHHRLELIFFFLCVLDALFDLPCFYCFQKSHMLYSPSAFLGRRDVCMSSEREGVPKHIEMFLFEEKKNKKKTSRFDF